MAGTPVRDIARYGRPGPTPTQILMPILEEPAEAGFRRGPIRRRRSRFVLSARRSPAKNKIGFQEQRCFGNTRAARPSRTLSLPADRRK